MSTDTNVSDTLPSKPVVLASDELSPSECTHEFLSAAGLSNSQAYDRVQEMARTKIDRLVLEYLVSRICAVADVGLERSRGSASLLKEESTEGANRKTTRLASSRARHQITAFADRLLALAEVNMRVLLGVLVYIDRAKPYLLISLAEWAYHRVFLGALILASKYLNDSSFKNVTWSRCTGIFGRRDILRIESEFLSVLDFELAIREEHLLPLYDEIVTLRQAQETMTLRREVKTQCFVGHCSPARVRKVRQGRAPAQVRAVDGRRVPADKEPL